MQAGYDLLQRIITYIVDPAILLIFSIGFLLFIWGLVVFISNPEDAAKRKTGLQHMVWGILGMFIMIASEGIIKIVIGTFDLQVPPQPFSGGFGGSTTVDTFGGPFPGR